ncbi:MAG: Na+ dependent nucleoside transporter [Schleiferiaceae bacterium]|nr:Na+ dependent nucleoside transporter [Schleiferiaceae bacterium]
MNLLRTLAFLVAFLPHLVWSAQNDTLPTIAPGSYPIGSSLTDSLVLDSNFRFVIYSDAIEKRGTLFLEKNSAEIAVGTDSTETYLMEYLPSGFQLTNASHSYIVTTTIAPEEANGYERLNALKNGNFDLGNFARGLLGLLVLLIICVVLSSNRRRINWGLVVKGLAIQLLFALAILKVPQVESVFDYISRAFVSVLSFASEGAQFLFGSLIQDTTSFGYIFAFQVLPTVVFFSALTSLLYYFGVLQKVVYVFAWVMKRTLKLSGAESLAAAGNVFLGQTESPLLVKPYIENMTRSELLCLMAGGMATIAGGVLAAYINFLGGPELEGQLFFAKHLLAASVMSAPAAVVAAKILLPETEPFETDMKISKNEIGGNWLEAISNGTGDGLRLAINVGAMLLVFIALIALVNAILTDLIGEWLGLNSWVASLSGGQYEAFSLQFILGYTLAPITWVMGVHSQDITLVGQLLGEKTILNEFVAYATMGNLMEAGKFTEERSVIIATYILCGFSNFASIGIQIGGIGALAPKRRTDISKLGIKALIAGTMASLFTAVLVGMLI